jgi:hypothetical protein
MTELEPTRTNSNLTATDELLPFPFCGSRTLYEGYHNLDGFDVPVMFCDWCKAMVSFEGYEDYVTDENDGMTELRAAWNRRADHDRD